ncbi:MAG: Aspartate aminotransferase [Candidatus Tokpelaia hoelldobleri]|uniref:cysteine-S-conjugate beta-lyase n=1 Tax=Candidatus Tokpelaia hoelldobleri TaxID=1902579 RepID=A0A1U9JSK8_9HYPH|nr:MAG: Aspartate aminotransferase [Candidatus Tokpelaia hoelldoblerii]
MSRKISASYPFDETIDRTCSNSLKWVYGKKRLQPRQAAADPLPMWVADMDFRVAPVIEESMARLLRHGVFGYGGVPDSYIEAVTAWQEKRHGWQAAPESLVLSPGVVVMLNMIVQALTKPGDSVLVQPPVYLHFHEDVINNGRRIAWAPLRLEDDRYVFDAGLFEQAITADTRLFILCNPHNPTGNVWSREDLQHMGDICRRHNVLVVSDEIHADFVTNPACKHIPFASLGEDYAQNSIICTSAGKAFNIAGLQCSNHFIADRTLRGTITRHLAQCGLTAVNVMGMTATEAAYREGEGWLEAFLAHIRRNQEFFATAINQAGLPMRVLPMDSLYLAWLDCRQMGLEAAKLNDFMLTKARLWLDDGRKFGRAGHGFMRINLACTRKIAEEAVTRLQAALS